MNNRAGQNRMRQPVVEISKLGEEQKEKGESDDESEVEPSPMNLHTLNAAAAATTSFNQPKTLRNSKTQPEIFKGGVDALNRQAAKQSASKNPFNAETPQFKHGPPSPHGSFDNTRNQGFNTTQPFTKPKRLDLQYDARPRVNEANDNGDQFSAADFQSDADQHNQPMGSGGAQMLPQPVR